MRPQEKKAKQTVSSNQSNEKQVKQVSFKPEQASAQQPGYSEIVNRVLRSSIPERKEQKLSTKVVDCHDSLEGQVFSNRNIIDGMSERNCGLRHARELIGKFRSGWACLLNSRVVS